MLVFDSGSHPGTFRDLFVRNYASVRQRCANFSEPGLAVVAIDSFTGRLTGILCVAAKVGAANSAIIGRHSMTDLYLDGDASLSLRHLAVVVSPLESSPDNIRFRVIDLRTQAAFQDEHGRRFEGLVAEGPLFVRCGNYALMCLVTGDPTAWPERAEDAWSFIPERVYLQADSAEPDRWRRKKRNRGERRLRGRGRERRLRGEHSPGEDDERQARGKPRKRAPFDRQGAVTLVQGELGPVRAQTRLLGDGEEPIGALKLRVGDKYHAVLVGPQAMRRGILLGRYERCDVDGSKLLTSESISRVHLLVVQDGERVYAIDTASTNGTWVLDDDREVRIIGLDVDVELCLGNDLAYLRWSSQT